MTITLNGTTGVTTTGLTSNGIDDNATSTAMTINSSGNVGIGSGSLDSLMARTTQGYLSTRVNNYNITAGSSAYAFTGVNIYQDANGLYKYIDTGASSSIHYWGGDIQFHTAASGTADASQGSTERMRIDLSGSWMAGNTVPRTASQYSNQGGASWYQPDQHFEVSTTGNRSALEVGKNNANDGQLITLRKQGTTIGSIGVGSGVMNVSGLAGTGLGYSTNLIYPSTGNSGAHDNAMDLGVSYARFDDIFATNGTIQTSDRNEKQDVAALTATEMLVAARISGLFKTFRWIDSVADKGDNARTHTGVIAQDVQAAFIAEGLDAGDYALFTSATWWETQTDVAAVEADEDNEIEAADAYTRTDTFDTLDEAPDGATERTRMGIRYPELLAFVGSYNEQRFASIETRLAALEAV